MGLRVCAPIQVFKSLAGDWVLTCAGCDDLWNAESYSEAVDYAAGHARWHQSRLCPTCGRS